MRRRALLSLCALLGIQTVAAGGAATPKHEAGRCALRGHCGAENFFSPSLPCVDNGRAKVPDIAVRQKLVKVCGEQWTEGRVCCLGEQVDALEENFKRVDQLVATCPACRENFVNLFCQFTCSPDQSLFVNVTDTAEKKGKVQAKELDYLVSDAYGNGFYDSCKEVKFGATNGKVMEFIGGGAKNYGDFLAFLGQKRFGGSPFQLDFPAPIEDEFPDMEPMNKKTWNCDTKDERFRCQCVDCPGRCIDLPELKEQGQCHVGVLPCLTFAVLIVYSLFIVLLVVAVSAHIAYRKHTKNKNERLRLLQDAAPSDDEDEGDIVHNASLLDRPQTHYYLNSVFDDIFSRLGYTCAEFPAITISISVLLVGLLSLGWLRFAIETDPVRLWVAPDSAAAQEKIFFDNSFGPFFRTEQVFLVNDTTADGPSPILSYETLRWWTDVESRVSRLRATGGIGFDDVCYKPLGTACVVQSVTGYFESKRLDSDQWASDLKQCVSNPSSCLPSSGAPLNPKLVLGGWEPDNVLDAKAIVVTWVVKNAAEGTEQERKAAIWEDELKRMLLDIQQEARDRGLRLSFNTEVSLEQELNKSTNTDAKIVVISYIIMFIYASLALGSTTLSLKRILEDPTSLLVQSKFMLGVSGILIVLMSVSASVGLFSAAGIKVTLIIAEVIPFLVLAVGVDNIFLIVHEFERVNNHAPELSVPERMAKALGRMGPSILLSATTETVSFALGATVGMPAVRNFAVYAAGAVFINALLQVTMFISVLAVNQRRVEAGRADCIPCLTVSRPDPLTTSMYSGDDESALQKFIRKTYAPGLLGKKAKVAIITIFLGLFATGLGLLPAVQLGLDQRIAIPSDSYLIQYFDDMDSYLGVGAPVYFVTKDVNVTDRKRQEQLCGRFVTCKTDSLSNILEQERKRSNVSYIADAAASWVDDFFFWLNPALDSCCVDGSSACFDGRDPPWNVQLEGMPQGEEYISYLDRWQKATNVEECALAGAAAYADAIVIDKNDVTIPASHFRTSHTPLRSQKEFINAYKSARRISDDISQRHGITVFPYSKFYIFFDQYVTIVRLSATLIGTALALIFMLTAVLLGSIATAFTVTTVVGMTVIDIIGAMAVMGVSLNAVSLVNIIICVGISLEFCAHIARAFTFPSAIVMDQAPKHRFRGKDARAWTALVNVGGSVFSGITVTKFLGVAVLAFTRSKIFEIYYFRVWVSLVVLGALHALVLLPVVLSIFGGRGKISSGSKNTGHFANDFAGYVDPESEGGLEQDLRSRRYPALLGNDDEDSDEY